MHTDQDLYRRSVAALLASWEEDARGSAGAALTRLPGLTVEGIPVRDLVWLDLELSRSSAGPAGRGAGCRRSGSS
jgi:hypothetical protein